MIFLSASSMFAVFIYCFIGIFAFQQNPKSAIHRIFLCLCISYAIWSFGYAFVYLLDDKYAISIWNKLAAIGWCSFSALSLYLVLLITEHPIIKNQLVRLAIFLPGLFFFYLAVFQFGPEITTPHSISKVFYIGDFLYNFSYLLTSIILLLVWGIKSPTIRVKKQSRILVLSSLLPFILTLITQTILPALGLFSLPNMGQLYSVIMILGAYTVITRYKFLKIPDHFIFEEIMREMLDLTILINENGQIIKVNKQALVMLGYANNELLGKAADTILPQIDFNGLLAGQCKENLRLADTVLQSVDGNSIPINLSCTPVFDLHTEEILGAVLVIQDLRLVNELKQKNSELHEKAIRDSLTNLYNHQYSIEFLEKQINITMEYKQHLSIMMLDIDHFKNLNDCHGHQFGDTVLKAVAGILLDCVPESGFVGRYGGEEFIIILPETELELAIKVGDKIRNEVKNHIFDNHTRITISIGIKEYVGENASKLITNTDQLLYLAKQNGRNRIEYSHFA